MFEEESVSVRGINFNVFNIRFTILIVILFMLLCSPVHNEIQENKGAQANVHGDPYRSGNELVLLSVR